MNDHYLWDRTGPPDPESQNLEALLRPLADAGTPRRAHTNQTNTNRTKTSLWWTLAAALLLAAGLYFRPTAPGWDTPQGRLAVGQWLNATQATHLSVASIGTLDVAAGSRLRLESSQEGNYRVRLERGKLDALIFAPPRQFFVDTPTAVAVDLGCAYSLEVDPAGETRVTVRSGWVAFESKGEEAFIPAGAHCRTSPVFGLGVPVYNDASIALQQSVKRFEESSELALPADLRPQDGLTLWHLLRRVLPAQRAALFDQFARLVTLPAGVSRASVIAGEREALDSLWSALQLGDSAFWRRWRQKLE